MIYINLLIVVLFIITIHEFGHYLASRLFKVDVTEFSIGFGKSIFQYTDKNNTKWKLSLIPLGGYVKIKGLENIFQKKENYEFGSFQSLNLYKKIIILLAGSIFNIVSAWIIILGLLFFVGIVNLKPQVSEVLIDSPAYNAGLLPGDLIIAINDNQIKNFNELKSYIEINEYLKLDILRNSDLIIIKLKSTYDENLNKNTIGIMINTDNLIYDKYNFLSSLNFSIKSISNFYYLNFSLLQQSFKQNNLSNDLAGPIGIVKKAEDFGLNTTNGIINLFIAFSLIVSLFNLLPIPLLDGGHILYFTISRVFSNSLPEFVTKLYLITGVTIISFLFIIITFNDIFYK